MNYKLTLKDYFTTPFKITKFEIESGIKKRFIQITPMIYYSYGVTKTIYIGWLFWTIIISWRKKIVHYNGSGKRFVG